jgi:hypothetical protein
MITRSDTLRDLRIEGIGMGMVDLLLSMSEVMMVMVVGHKVGGRLE